MELVTRHWSGKHGRVVQGINLITLLWTEGDRHIPLDYRFYEKSVNGASLERPFSVDAGNRQGTRLYSKVCSV